MAQHPSGAGLSTVIMSFLLTTYYNVIMSWALFYLVYSFSPSLPWEVGWLNKTTTQLFIRFINNDE